MSNKSVTLRVVLLGACLTALAACTTLSVRTDTNPTFPVVSCHTYAFAQEHVANADQPAAYANPLNAERLRDAIEANLAARGIQRGELASADCVIGYAMGSRQVFNDYYGGFGGGWGYGWGHGWGPGPGFYGAWGWDGPMVQDETRVAIDIFDGKSRKPMWHASVSQSVYDLRGPRAVEKINAAVAAIFAKFPAGMPPPPAGRAA